MSEHWIGLVDPDSGDLVSVGTDATIGPDTPTNLLVHDFGAQPDFGTHVWDVSTRSLKARPAPVMKDRLDDIEAWLMSDSDFSQAWGTMNQQQRTAVRTGVRRVLVRVAGARRFREQSEAAELD
jgi:hypothetical protein